MRCPKCTVDRDKVTDSRPHNDGATRKRRHECKACGNRWWTAEVDLEAWEMMLEIAGMQLAIDAEKPALAEKARAVLGRYFQN